LCLNRPQMQQSQTHSNLRTPWLTRYHRTHAGHRASARPQGAVAGIHPHHARNGVCARSHIVPDQYCRCRRHYLGTISQRGPRASISGECRRRCRLRRARQRVTLDRFCVPGSPLSHGSHAIMSGSRSRIAAARSDFDGRRPRRGAVHDGQRASPPGGPGSSFRIRAFRRSVHARRDHSPDVDDLGLGARSGRLAADQGAISTIPRAVSRETHVSRSTARNILRRRPRSKGWRLKPAFTAIADYPLKEKRQGHALPHLIWKTSRPRHQLHAPCRIPPVVLGSAASCWLRRAMPRALA